MIGMPKEATEALRDLNAMREELTRMRKSMKDISELLYEQNKIIEEMLVEFRDRTYELKVSLDKGEKDEREVEDIPET